MEGIGIVGAGVAGLHLGLLLRGHGVPVTIYSDRTAEQLAGGRIPNTVAHHHATVERERLLGVDHWDIEEYGYFGHHHYIGGPQPLRFPGFFAAPSRALDYRIYLPRLLSDFVERGGEFEVRPVQAVDVEELSQRHDLVVIATGRGSMGAMFPRRADKSPYDTPQRKLCGGLYEGVAHSEPKGVTMSISPGHGELLAIPMYSFAGHVTALLFEAVPGGEFEVLTATRYDDDPATFEKLVLKTISEHHPTIFERIDPAAFRLTGPQDLLQGAVVPSVREDYTRLPNGRYVVAVGDVHTVVDPVIGQGANSASYSAWELGQTILEDQNFDERFCKKVARRREDRVHAVSDWTNLMIRTPPPPHLLELLGAMSQNQAIADTFTDNFSYPERQWDILATPERTRNFLTGHGMS
ncbi:2-polyprenyl-6-methoxyphenol hydroxylase-like FAD-dependent oxidoreductase [Saccharomonospora amisosensis]|uniref:2-polyprenyl-6-methoxyphenol hydroxylase-like FAD-dependent oxidoreductase n=1 Tax=Saccharomonospora amisosensis TaxID=1128677 RepID=A0A7X5UKX8_9PSEU|nr:styrene monooxygenase/indole monooxygenase family protein [Saccharomonospora amisosensis]NIJ09906.1 2-polyprenyl-6-methoxyphenol hydroxylase-like FAD-dependent oxidoreductase [Saccharomonospora amisosensis]